MGHVVAIIDEAWEHRRQRYRSLGIMVLAAALIAAVALVIIASGSGQNTGSGAVSSNDTVVPPSAVLARPPYMGVNCPVPNSIACDRVGLAVWLRRPATSVTATIAGARLALNTGNQLTDSLGRRSRAFDGYLQPAGIVSRLRVRPVSRNVLAIQDGHTRVIAGPKMWFGEGEPSARVQLTIRYGSGQIVVTHLRVSLNAGWG